MSGSTTSSPTPAVDVSAAAAPAPAPAPTPTNPVVDRLVSLGLDTRTAAGLCDDLGLTSVDDLSMLTVPMLAGLGVKMIPATKIVNACAAPTPTPAPAPTPTPAPSAGLMAGASVVLPEVPVGLSLLSRLRVGGVMRVKTDTLVGAVRVLFTERCGFFDLVERLRDSIEQRAEKTKRPVPPIFLKLDSLAKSADYAEMMNLLRDEGLSDRRRYTSKAEKDKLFSAMGPIFSEFQAIQNLLEKYLGQMMAGGNPQVMTQALLAAISGVPNPGLALMMQPTPPTALVAAISGLIDRINSMFAGTRAITAAALQPDVASVASILDNEELYAALGATDREQMLEELGLSASVDLIQLEQDVLKYIVSVLDIPSRDSASQPMVIGAVSMLGSQIQWDRLNDLAMGRNLDKKPEPRRALPGTKPAPF